MGGAAGSELGSPEGGGVISDFALRGEGLPGVGRGRGKSKVKQRRKKRRQRGETKEGERRKEPGNVILKPCRRASARVHPGPWLCGQCKALLLQDTV